MPLFQAYPQAVRTATLPACVQADSLLRAHQKRELINNSNINHPDLGDQKALFVDMARKKHRRNSSSVKLDWTTKLYVLVTSGYLLQYSGDGTHDRLPEKVIQLCKDWIEVLLIENSRSSTSLIGLLQPWLECACDLLFYQLHRHFSEFIILDSTSTSGLCCHPEISLKLGA